MRAYRTKSRQELGLTPSAWTDLQEFLETIEPVIEETRDQGVIEMPPPQMRSADYSDTNVFDPGGWVGRYPGNVDVSPDKFTEAEYQQMMRTIAGWIEVWDLPTAAAVLPLYQAEVRDERTMLLGYSQALQDFSDDMLAQRPPVNVQRTTETGSRPRGTIDFNQTIQARAREGQQTQVVYDRLQFSFDHPINQLFIRFHAELEAQLDQLATQSQTLTSQLRCQQQYHTMVLEEQFSDILVEQSCERSLAELVSTSYNHRDVPGYMEELLDLAEAYLQRRALRVDFQHRLSVGLKPVSKMYELWVLAQVLEELQSYTDHHPQLTEEGIHEITIGPAVTVYYNTALQSHSRILADGLHSHPGRPDFAIVVNGTVAWIGDAKYSPERNIDLQDYQRLLSYTVDLMPTDSAATAAIIHVDRHASRTKIETDDYNVSQFSCRPGQETTILTQDILDAIEP